MTEFEVSGEWTCAKCAKCGDNIDFVGAKFPKLNEVISEFKNQVYSEQTFTHHVLHLDNELYRFKMLYGDMTYPILEQLIENLKEVYK